MRCEQQSGIQGAAMNQETTTDRRAQHDKSTRADQHRPEYFASVRSYRKGEVGRRAKGSNDNSVEPADGKSNDVKQPVPRPDSGENIPILGSPNMEKTPAEKVRMILQEREEWEDDDPGEVHSHILFCQLDVLCTFKSSNQGWKEMARWLKFEEKVELGNRWSKPHVATTSLHSLFAIREGFASGNTLVVLDLELKYGTVHQRAVAEETSRLTHKSLAGVLTNLIVEKKQLTVKTKQMIFDCLMKPHKHKHRKEKGSTEKSSTENTSPPGKNKKETDGELPAHFVPIVSDRRRASIYHTNYASGGLQVDDLMPHKPNKKLLKKIPKGTEAANLMIGHCEFLSEPIFVFARLTHSYPLADLTEVDLPSRFIFLGIGPTQLHSIYEYEEIGRAMGGLLSDQVFCQLAYKAKSTQDLVDGMDEFIDSLTVLPPSVWDPTTRLDPPEKTLTQARIQERVLSPLTSAGPETFDIGDGSTNDLSLQRTGRLFGGLWTDIKRRYPLYASDIKDALSIQCVASVVFLYFACITPIVTFGALLGDGTGLYMGTMETLLSGAVCGSVWAVFSGQPLIIVGATGPMLIFESLLYSFSSDRGIDFLSFRFWIGMWVMLILLVIVAFDLSALVRYITRFTEESFAVLISLIFIFEAFKKTYSVWEKAPININPHRGLDCYCVPPDENSTSLLTTMNPNVTRPEPYTFANFSSGIGKDCVNSRDQLIVNHQCLHKDRCIDNGWLATGTGCDTFTYIEGVPDVFLISVFLFLGTFFIALKIRNFRTQPYFPSLVRTNISDFAVLLAILLMCALDVLLGLGSPKLKVPSELKTTREDRTWLVNPMAIAPWYMILLALLPALLAVILIFLDQQITAVIVNRREHKLRKGHGYHLDLAVLSFLIGLCALFGLPWFVAATVRAITHVRSLVQESATSAPGERPEMLGVREQRVTGLLIHILIGMSTLITGVLNYVPMPVLYGVFLYMGVTSLAGVQFIERIGLLFMPQKYQPDYIYLRHVQTRRVHIFTVIQIFCMVAMWAVKSVNVIAICFPIMVLAVCFVRKALDKLFTQNELYWLDHLLPEAVRRQKEDDGEDSDDEYDLEEDIGGHQDSIKSEGKENAMEMDSKHRDLSVETPLLSKETEMV